MQKHTRKTKCNMFMFLKPRWKSRGIAINYGAHQKLQLDWMKLFLVFVLKKQFVMFTFSVYLSFLK